MNNRTPSVEWTIAQSDAEWERLQEPPAPEGEADAPRQRRLKQSFWSVAAFFLLLVGGWWWHTDQVRAHQAAAAATATAQEVFMVEAHNEDRPSSSSASTQSGMDWWIQYSQEYSSLQAAVQTADPAAHLDGGQQRVAMLGAQAVAGVTLHSKDGVPSSFHFSKAIMRVNRWRWPRSLSIQ